MLKGLLGAWIAAACVGSDVGRPALAASVPSALLGNLHWRSIGPYRGGRVLAVAADPVNRQQFYFGAVNGGIWRTQDAGRTWQPIFDAAPVGSIGALAVAPSDAAVLYAGTGEADMRSDIAQGTGIYRSGDGGAHWASIGLQDTQQIGKILVDPRNQDVVLVAALGHPYGPNDMRGVFRTTDGGQHWARVLFHDADTGAIDLAFEPGHPDIVYAALWQTRRPPWNVYPPSNGPGSGLYKSVDGGQHWAALTGHGLPPDAGRIGIALSEARPQRVYALIDAKEGGLFRSEDAGGTWARVSDDARTRERAWYFSGITADPGDADRIYVCDTIVLRSDDGGSHFIPLKGDPTGDDFHVLWIDPKDNARRILGVDQGTLISMNGGASWSSWFNQPTGQFYHVSTDNRFPYRVYGAQQDSGAAGVESRSDSPSDGISMMQFHESAAGGESDNIAPDPDDPDVVYGGRVDRLDLKSGQLRSIDPTLAFPDDYRGTWTLPLVFGPLDHRLYFGNQRVFRTEDGGQHWVPISPDLTREDPGVPPTVDAVTRADSPRAGMRRGVVYAIAPSPVAAGLIWAGTDDGKVWRTNDAGLHWQDVTPPSLAAWSKVGVVEASHFDTTTAYLAVDRHRLEDFAPYILRTKDGGRNWVAIVDGLATGTLNSVNVVREDPVQPGLLFAGTERGAFVSFDDGAHWQELQAGLPRTSVRDMVIHGDDLVIATHGRGFYIMDDIVSLRALAKDAAAGPRLFPVARAVRLHPPPFTGTPMPKDEPMAANPPAGALIDYALPADYAGEVTISITDAAGRLVRRFSSRDLAPKLDLGKLEIAPEWAPVSAPPQQGAGAHRFVWDLRYDKPASLAGLDPPAEGIWAPPGAYEVTLQAGGPPLRQTVQVIADPRLALRSGDLQAEFALAQAVEQARIACHTMMTKAVKLRAGLAAKGLGARYETIIGTRFDPFAAKFVQPAAIGSLAEIASRLDKLAVAVDGADARPSADAQTAFQQAAAALDQAKAAWKDLQSAQP